MASILSSNGTNNLNYTGEFTKLFGQEDANLVIDLFKEILHGSLDRYYGCYSCPDRGIVLIKAKEQWLKAGNPRNMFIRHGRSVLREWEKNTPKKSNRKNCLRSAGAQSVGTRLMKSNVLDRSITFSLSGEALMIPNSGISIR